MGLSYNGVSLGTNGSIYNSGNYNSGIGAYNGGTLPETTISGGKSTGSAWQWLLGSGGIGGAVSGLGDLVWAFRKDTDSEKLQQPTGIQQYLPFQSGNSQGSFPWLWAIIGLVVVGGLVFLMKKGAK